MKYDFDTPVNRKNTASLKWDVKEGELPMWVADMDFKTSPEIARALFERVSHGVFGYSVIPSEWYEAYISWWRKKHGFTMEKEWLDFCTGVIPAISSAVRKLTTPAEKVVIQTPVYNIFFNSILNNGRQVLENPLKYENGEYDMDFKDLEKKLSDPQTTLMILCNPHNPVGKIWDKATLAKVGELCQRYHVTLISDEIHCDITEPGKEYTPFASASDICKKISVTCIAPTKAFNIAGLQSAAICTPNEAIRNRIRRSINTDEVAEPNAFAICAAICAFTQGGEWLCELNRYISENRQIVGEFIKKELDALHLIPSQATYLLWVDCSNVTDDVSGMLEFIRNKTGLYLSDGKQFGGNGSLFFRMNIACPKITLYDGLQRLKIGITEYINIK